MSFDKWQLEFKKRDIYYDKTIVYLTRDTFYNVVRFEPVSEKHEHFLIHTFTVRKKKKDLQSASRSRLILDIVAYLNMVEKYSFTCDVNG